MRDEYKNPLQPAINLTSEAPSCPKIGTTRGLSRLTGAFNPARETGVEEKINAPIIKRARATLRITQSTSKFFSVKSIEEPKLSRVPHNPQSAAPRKEFIATAERDREQIDA